MLEDFMTTLPHTVMVDVADFGREALRFVARLRNRFSAARIPVIAIIHADQPAEFREALIRQQECYILDANIEEKSLHEQINIIMECRYEERGADQPHPHGLEKLTQIWRTGAGGLISCKNSGKTTAISNGGITDTNGEAVIKSGIYGDGFLFEHRKVNGFGDWITVGRLLWTAAQECTAPGFLRERRNLRMVFTEFQQRAEDLPLTEHTRRLLTEKVGEQTLQQHLQDLGIRFSLVEKDIETLCILGLLRFSRPNPRPKPKEIPEEKQLTSFDAAALLNELRFRSADPLAVFNIEKSTDLLELQERAKAQIAHLNRMTNTLSLPELKHLAHKLHQRCVHAQRQLESLAEAYRYFGCPDDINSPEECHFRQAHYALQEGDLVEAYGEFTEALLLSPNSKRDLAYALWIRGQLQPNDAHETLGYLVELEIALPHNPLIQRFLISVELANKEVEKSLRRAERLEAHYGLDPTLVTLKEQIKNALQ